MQYGNTLIYTGKESLGLLVYAPARASTWPVAIKAQWEVKLCQVDPVQDLAPSWVAIAIWVLGIPWEAALPQTWVWVISLVGCHLLDQCKTWDQGVLVHQDLLQVTSNVYNYSVWNMSVNTCSNFMDGKCLFKLCGWSEKLNERPWSFKTSALFCLHFYTKLQFWHLG